MQSNTLQILNLDRKIEANIFGDPDDEFDVFCYCGRMRGGKIFLNLENPSTVLFAVKGIPVKCMLSTAMVFGWDVSALNRV